MILCFIYILISVTPLPLQADENQLPSFRSSVVTDGKPILRGGGPEPEEEEAPDNDVSEEVASSSAEDSETSNIVDDLAVFVKWLMENYGYNIHQETRRSDHTEDTTTDASPGIQLRSHHKKRTQKNGSELIPQRRNFDVLKEVRKGREILRKKHMAKRKLEKDFKRGVRQRRDKYSDKVVASRRANNINESTTETKPAPMDDSEATMTVLNRRSPRSLQRYSQQIVWDTEPSWKTNLRAYMTELIGRVPRSSIDEYSLPVIRAYQTTGLTLPEQARTTQAIEKQNKVKITDIDVNHFGLVMIDYVDMSNKDEHKINIDQDKQTRQGKRNEYVSNKNILISVRGQ